MLSAKRTNIDIGKYLMFADNNRCDYHHGLHLPFGDDIRVCGLSTTNRQWLLSSNGSLMIPVVIVVDQILAYLPDRKTVT
jgi:hypothetical protein